MGTGGVIHLVIVQWQPLSISDPNSSARIHPIEGRFKMPKSSKSARISSVRMEEIFRCSYHVTVAIVKIDIRMVVPKA